MTQHSFIRSIRQHHAIEHATITLLGERLPGVPLMGRSDPRGFILVGNVEASALRSAADEALARLKAGEKGLAIHPNCGTNLVAAGILSGVAALVAGGGRRRSVWDRVPSAILGATFALMLAAPAGRWLQANVTTEGDVDGLEIASITRLAGGPITSHRVAIRAA
jgi:hypothetical protein